MRTSFRLVGAYVSILLAKFAKILEFADLLSGIDS
jgi:hypothetical protein